MSAAAGHVEVLSSLDECRERWSELALLSKNIFSTWEWASVWWRHYGRSSPLIVACHDPRELVALLPLYLWSSRPVRVGRFIGHGPADQLGPVCGPSDSSAGADALRSVMNQLNLALVVADLLPGRDEWAGLLGRQPLLVEASPTISLDQGWNGYLAGRSANLRQQIRRRERQLGRQHDLRYRLAVDRDRLQDELTLLFELHRARWGHGSPFLRFERFHREFAAVAFDQGWLRLWFLELDGRPAAAWYGFRFAGVESYYQAGRDPELAHQSVGFTLLAHSIRQAADDGMYEYRLLRGAESFKFRFACGDPGVQTFAVPRGIAGHAAEIAAGAAIRRSKVRSLLRRLADARTD